jgi:hypothetical protein
LHSAKTLEPLAIGKNFQSRGKVPLAEKFRGVYLKPPNRFPCTTLVALTTLLLDRIFSWRLESRAPNFFEKRFPQTEIFCASMTLC